MSKFSSFNKGVHESDTDSEKALDAQHAALGKMMEGAYAARPLPPAPAVPSVAPISGVAPVAPVQSFAGLHAALASYKPMKPVKSAGVKKLFHKRI